MLVEAAAAAQHPPGSDGQKIGDFYHRVHGRGARRAAGAEPAGAGAEAIEALSTKADLARYFARQVKLGIGGAPLAGGVDGDAKDPTRNMLYIGQGGIGLPDRDYYLKDDAKLKEYRTKYVAYITTVAHRRPGAGPGRGRRRHPRLRDPSGPRALDQRREPRRGEDLQQGGDRRPAGAVPRPRLGGVDRRAGHRRRTGAWSSPSRASSRRWPPPSPPRRSTSGSRI